MRAEHDKIARIFSAAVELATPPHRAAYLDAACGHDQRLRAEIDELLKHDEAAGSFLEKPDTSGPAATADEHPHRECPGTVIGPYKLLQQIGEGGMGVVFMAEQTQPVRRKVALKVIKAGMDSRLVIARFEAERQSLALMDHVNIARVLDAGETASGLPYFVMELVHGVAITKYCDDNRLTPRERLELFVPVCQAIQHAHQKGIIHRDVKPSNVMITLYDGKPSPKVIDFGVAKATEQKLTERTLFTQYGTMVGTPQYMSPEQAEMSALGVDTRSDIYSLGVLLYELLTGSTPLNQKRLREAAYPEVIRMIKEEEPPRPSTRLSDSGEALASISSQRHIEPARLTRLVRGELDWIVMKCLEKDRNRRYETAAALAADVQRYLNDEPVQACPPSVGYRFGKFARRHKVAFATCAAVTVAVLAAMIGLAVTNVRIAREKADKETALADAEANLLLARQAVDEIYTPVADQLNLVPHMQPYQRDVLEKSLRFYQEFARREGSDPTIRLEATHASLRVAQIQMTLGQRGQHEQTCRAVLATLHELEQEPLVGPRRRLYLVETLYTLGGISATAGRGQEAEQNYRQAVAVCAELVAEYPNMPNYRILLATSHNALATRQHDRPYEAKQNHDQAIRLCEELVKEWPDDPGYLGELLHSYYQLGRTLARMDRLPPAEGALRQAVAVFERAPTQLNRSGYRSLLPAVDFELGKVLAALGRTGEAATAQHQAVDLGEKQASQFPEILGYRQALLWYYLGLAKTLVQTGQRDEAARFGRLAIELNLKLTADLTDGTQPRDQALANLSDLGTALRDAGQWQAAEQAFRGALELAKKLAADAAGDPSSQYRLAHAHNGLGTVLQRTRRFPEAADAYRAQLAIVDKLAAAHPDDPDYRFYQARAGNYLGIVLRGMAKENENAVFHHRKAVKLCEQLVAQYPDRPRFRHELVRSHYALGLALEPTGRWTEVEASYSQAVAASVPLLDQPPDPGYQPPVAPSVHSDLAWLLATCPEVKLRDPKRAVELARLAVKLDPRASYWNTLGVAEYRQGNYKEALTALEKSMDLHQGGDSHDWFFLAMAHWRLGDKEKAREWYDKAVEWMEKHRATDEELRRFRTEAAELLGIAEKK